MFFFVFSGIGPVALVLGVLGALAGLVLPEQMPRLAESITAAGVPVFAAGMITAGVLTAILGFVANRKPWTHVVSDPDTGMSYRVGTASTLYWIPIQYWGLLFIGIGVANYMGITEIAGIGLY